LVFAQPLVPFLDWLFKGTKYEWFFVSHNETKITVRTTNAIY
jgi:hypothetical protein